MIKEDIEMLLGKLLPDNDLLILNELFINNNNYKKENFYEYFIAP